MNLLKLNAKQRDCIYFNKTAFFCLFVFNPKLFALLPMATNSILWQCICLLLVISITIKHMTFIVKSCTGDTDGNSRKVKRRIIPRVQHTKLLNLLSLVFHSSGQQTFEVLPR